MMQGRCAIFLIIPPGFDVSNARRITAAILVLALSACAPTIPPGALKLNATSLERKQLQTRRFDGITQDNLIAACNGVLQDLGFNLDESETRLGVLVASKERSAKDAGQIAAMIFIAAIGGGTRPVDDTQKIRVSLVVRPSADGNSEHHLARVTFQRVVTDTSGKISLKEGIFTPEVYQEFFDKLSKAVFLEAHKI